MEEEEEGEDEEEEEDNTEGRSRKARRPIQALTEDTAPPTRHPSNREL